MCWLLGVPALAEPKPAEWLYKSHVTKESTHPLPRRENWLHRWQCECFSCSTLLFYFSILCCLGWLTFWAGSRESPK